MRTEKEMMGLILGVAMGDERVRAVAMNGSRANPRARRDRFQDYDIVYLVSDVATFREDRHWVDIFGERVVMQTPEDSTLFPPSGHGQYVYLMQFTDGNRIDLTLLPLECREEYVRQDSQTVVLLDKDRCMPPLPPPSDRDYWVKKPDGAAFRDCCNEFWWVAPYVAKGAWREEFLYAEEQLRFVRDMLLMMLDWWVGIRTDFTAGTGKCHKELRRLLPDDRWQQVLQTYPSGSLAACWTSLEAACRLFRATAEEVAAALGFTYDREEDRRVAAYLQWVKQLPAQGSDAQAACAAGN